MSSLGKKPKPLDERGVKKLVDAAVANDGHYIESFSLHARFDHPERHLSIDDILHALKKRWRSCKVDHFDDDQWQWSYRVQTSDIEDRELVVVVACDTKNIKFTVITAFYED